MLKNIAASVLCITIFIETNTMRHDLRKRAIKNSILENDLSKLTQKLKKIRKRLSSDTKTSHPRRITNVSPRIEINSD